MTFTSGRTVAAPHYNSLDRLKAFAARQIGVLKSLPGRGIAYLRDLFQAETETPIFVGSTEHHELNVAAMVSPGHDAHASDALFHELDRAHVVPDGVLEDRVIRMGSAVTYRTDGRADHRVTLVFPEQADPRIGKISVLSDVGTALIGLRPGQSIAWRAPDGRRRTLTVISVSQPLLAAQARRGD